MKFTITFVIALLCSWTALGQCFMDQHTTNWNDGWLSCKPSPSPNPIRGNSHWIMYNLGYKYALGQSHFWNHNEADGLTQGAKTIIADISLNGTEWTEWKRFDLPMASGSPVYEGIEGPDFEKIPARYLLLTAVDNYGGKCVGFSEMKIDVDILSQTDDSEACMNINAFPNPFTDQVYVNVSGKCIEGASVFLEDIMGRQVSPGIDVTSRHNTVSIATAHLAPGIYLVKIAGDGGMYSTKVIKAE